jgi:hypothetical protein
MDDGGTAVPPQYQGRGLHEPPKSRSRSRFRINLQRPLDLSSERGRVPRRASPEALGVEAEITTPRDFSTLQALLPHAVSRIDRWWHRHNAAELPQALSGQT